MNINVQSQELLFYSNGQALILLDNMVIYDEKKEASYGKIQTKFSF